MTFHIDKETKERAQARLGRMTRETIKLITPSVDMNRPMSSNQLNTLAKDVAILWEEQVDLNPNVKVNSAGFMMSDGVTLPISFVTFTHQITDYVRDQSIESFSHRLSRKTAEKVLTRAHKLYVERGLKARTIETPA